MAQPVKNLHAMREAWVQSLDWEDPLEKGRLPTPVIWPGEFHGLYSPEGHKESDTTERTQLSDFSLQTGWGGRWDGVQGWGTRIHPWLMRVNVW